MKKKLLLSLLLATSLMSYADDWSKLGYKGSGTKSAISGNNSGTESITFDNSGNLLGITTNRYGASFSTNSLTPNSSGFSGTCTTEGFNGKITITTGKYGIVKINIKYDTGSLTVTNSYDSEGKLSKKVYDESWYTEEELTFESNVEEEAARLYRNQQASANRMYERQQANANKLYEDYQKALLSGDPRKIKKAQDAYEKASRDNANDYMNESERNANRYMSNARAGFKKKKVKHTKHNVYYFSDYDFDEFGNWTTRTVKEESSSSLTKDNHEVQYTNEFLSEYYWNKLKDSGNFRAIERFALKSTTTEKYKKIAQDFWNANILDAVAKVDNNHCDSLCKIAFRPIAYQDVTNKALNIARKDIFDNQVMLERDFNKVLLFKNKKMSGKEIFDTNYKQKIDQRSSQLRSDSIAFLINKAENEIAKKQNAEASKTSRGLLLIDDNNARGKELAATSEFNLLEEKENNGIVIDKDYDLYRLMNVGSQYDAAVADKHIMYAINRKKEFKDQKRMCDFRNYLDSLSYLPMTESVTSRYKKAKKNATYSCEHGSFINVGIGGFAGYSFGNEYHVGGEIGARLGYLCNILNVYIAGKYSYSAGFNSMDSQGKHNDDGTKDGYLTAQRITIPAILRLNVKPGYHSAIYLGLGAEYSIPINAKYIYYNESLNKVESESDKKMLHKATIAPRFGIGVTARYLELELYGIYESGTLYDKEYLDKLGVESLIYKKQYDNQTDKGKLRVGLAVRLLF